MIRSHRLWPALVLTAMSVSLAIAVPRAGAADPFPDTGIVTLSSAHFQIHYMQNNTSYNNPCSNPLNWYITQEKAGEVLGMAERAYALYLSWGYAAPQWDNTDADQLIDISVDDFADQQTAPCGISYGSLDPAVEGPFNRWSAMVTPVTPAGAGQIHLDASTGLTYHTIAHEIFHLFQSAMLQNADQWLEEGSAEWAAFRAESFLTPTKQDLGSDPDRTADCVGGECGDTELDRNGYPGWLLFEYLSERFGADAVRAVWNQAASNAGASGVTDLANVLSGTYNATLSAFFNDYATARLSGNFSIAAIKNLLPTTQAQISVDDLSSPLPTTNVAVNHLAVRYVALKHGLPADVRAPCYAATLAINVAIPAGVISTPYYFANIAGSTPQALSVSGSNASITVPWNTCAGSPDAYLSLPNDTWSPGLDGREFVVTGSVTVDLNAPASPSDPSGARVSGPVVVAPSTDPAPTLAIHAPELLRVSAKTRVLRFIVYSSGSGKLRATLGPVSLGTASLRAGNNDVRWTLPVSVVSALRRTSSNNVLALTSLSPSGVTGATLTRHVVIVRSKPAAKKRHKR
jgi:hypothetical protein